MTELFVTFLKIGLFTFGGGYAMIPMIQHLCVEQKKWITHEEMMDITVVAESTPGPIAINCATFVGLARAGLPGATAATVGVVLPSFVIIFLISRFLDRFLQIGFIASAFRGIRIAVGLLILQAAVNMLKKGEKSPLSRFLTAGTAGIMLLGALLGRNISSIAVMLAAGAVLPERLL